MSEPLFNTGRYGRYGGSQFGDENDRKALTCVLSDKTQGAEPITVRPPMEPRIVRFGETLLLTAETRVIFLSAGEEGVHVGIDTSGEIRKEELVLDRACGPIHKRRNMEEEDAGPR